MNQILLHLCSETERKGLSLTSFSSKIAFIDTCIVPGKPYVSVKQADVDIVSVSWILEDKNGVIRHYNVTYFRADDSSDSRSLTTRQMKQDFEDLKDGKTYEFQVIVSFLTKINSDRPHLNK